MTTTASSPIFRLGRVFYWLSLIVALPAVIIGGGAIYSSAFDKTPDANSGLALILSLLWAAGSYGVGRAIRYVLSGY